MSARSLASGSVFRSITPQASARISVRARRKDHQEHSVSPAAHGGVTSPKATTPLPPSPRKVNIPEKAPPHQGDDPLADPKNDHPTDNKQDQKNKPRRSKSKHRHAPLSRTPGRRKRHPEKQVSRFTRNPLLIRPMLRDPLPQRATTGIVRR